MSPRTPHAAGAKVRRHDQPLPRLTNTMTTPQLQRWSWLAGKAMEHLWSRADAISGDQRRIREPRKCPADPEQDAAEDMAPRGPCRGPADRLAGEHGTTAAQKPGADEGDANGGGHQQVDRGRVAEPMRSWWDQVTISWAAIGPGQRRRCPSRSRTRRCRGHGSALAVSWSSRSARR